jgi:hypothetical protein
MLKTFRQDWLSNFRGDLLAGTVVALTLIPEAIAFSIIAGVDPQVGLYASFAGAWASVLTRRHRVDRSVADTRRTDALGRADALHLALGHHRLRQRAPDKVMRRRGRITLVHKGSIMKHTEGAFRGWGYEVARQEFGAVDIDGGQAVASSPELGL